MWLWLAAGANIQTNEEVGIKLVGPAAFEVIGTQIEFAYIKSAILPRARACAGIGEDQASATLV